MPARLGSATTLDGAMGGLWYGIIDGEIASNATGNV
jgi:hypothetical protein